MLRQAVHSGLWDVIMVGFNLLNQTAREEILPTAREHDMGTLCMFAVRRALRSWEAVVPYLKGLIESGELRNDRIDFADVQGTFTMGKIDTTLPDLAYRFVKAEAGLDVILSGTGNLTHIEENYHSIAADPLPQEVVNNLRALFHGVHSASGQ